MRRLSAVFLVAVLALFGCSRKEDEASSPQDTYVFPPVDIQRAFIAMAENPSAANALLIGESAKKTAEFFDGAGIKSHLMPTGRYGIVLVSCSGMSRESCAKVAGFLDDGGVLAWMIDVRGVTSSRFREILEDFDLPHVRVWMTGEKQWLITGSKAKRTTPLDDLFGLFSGEGVFDALATARCPAAHHLFASYAGTREDVMPAFSQGDQNAEVRPEYFVTKEIPSLDWIDVGDVDEDISRRFFAEARSMQVVRRLAIEGSMLAEAGREKEAIDAWSRASKRNARDLFVLERLDRLDRNAKGFFEVRKILMAMKCYETMVLINPDNPAPLNNFGVCLKKIGRLDIAERVFKRVRELENGRSR